MSKAPTPSRLMFLSQLKDINTGDKIRFLGCLHSVDSYDVPSATLILEHNFPADSGHKVVAQVDIEQLLDSVKHDDIQVGSWINIVAYVGKRVKTSNLNRNRSSRSKQFTARKETPKEAITIVNAKALMLWSAGAIKLDAYESSLQQYQQASEG
ncbi:hypothetical protein M8818_004253 [Zalaria obscura]|uniref:Uncharacterized protein n=1 Tax=Zalaria obscura TaxID=2024903 RepID=A0ACC3SCL8_9PEZI